MKIPNFHYVFDYNPSSNPIEGLTQQQKEEFAFEYMAMWCDNMNEYGWPELHEDGEYERLADELVSAGAINSELCYPSCKEIETIIEEWCKQYRSAK